MIKFVTAANRDQNRGLLDQMHRDRKRVFVDWLKWDVPVVGDMEIDQYDTDDAVYLLDVDPDTGTHIASIRLLPCSVPTLMAEHFADMVQSPVPNDDSAWEMTRLCANPDIKDKLVQWTGRKNITVAAIEFALMRGIKQLIFVTHASWVPTILSVGWDIELLGLPRKDGNESIAAMRINVTEDTLRLIRRNWGVSEPLLVLDDDTIAAVA
jgi:N-acyl-L-homoserine lactone synthetase